MEGKRSNLVNRLNSLTQEDRIDYWLNNISNNELRHIESDNPLEYNWYYFKNDDIWMCKVLDYDQAKEGKGYLRQVVCFEHKQDLINENNGAPFIRT